MSFLEVLQQNMPFLNTKAFAILYAIILTLNPIAMLPQLFSTFKAEAEQLKGVSLTMFFIYLAIQVMVTLGAIKGADMTLFVSMFVSAIITTLVIWFTYQRRKA